MQKTWRFRPHEPEKIRALERAAGVPAVLAQLLISRGVENPESARRFLDVKLTDLRDPDELAGVGEASERVHEAIRANRRIIVYGDYDVDGVTATVLLYRCLALLGADVGYYVPHRITEGYGLHVEALRRLASDGAEMVITVDCGVTSVDEARLAGELGIELIITDHHQLPDELPRAAALVHPCLPGREYPFAGLSGSGIAFKLAWAICQRASQAKRVSERMKQFLLQAIALAAIGTVADVVPLTDENRVLVRHGLLSLKQSPTLGLHELLRVSSLIDKPALQSEDIAFMLAPRLNAAGRLGQAQLAVELLTTESQERAKALAEYVHELNSSRQSLEQSIYLAANKQACQEFDPAADAALVLAGRGWHAGVIGIVAGRLAEKFHRPVVMLALDELGLKPAVGSARSIPGFDLHRALSACSEYLVSYGGHVAAAGLKLEESRLESFREAFRERAETELSAENRKAELWIDAEAPLSALTLKTVAQIERLAPFGAGNTRPIVCATGVSLDEPPRRMGGGGRHLSLKLSQHGVRLRGVAFGHSEWADELEPMEDSLAIAFRPIINQFRGRRTVELHIADWQRAEVAASGTGKASGGVDMPERLR